MVGNCGRTVVLEGDPRRRCGCWTGTSPAEPRVAGVVGGASPGSCLASCEAWAVGAWKTRSGDRALG
jgi:hypothetical protein